MLADETSRPAIIDAFKQRHSYAATDNIMLDVRCGDHLMGDEFETSQKPTLSIEAHGTTPIARVQVIRDNKYLDMTEPKTREVAPHLHRRRRSARQVQLLLRPHRAGGRQPRLGLADVDHL